jgi:hypothetical protein
LKPTRIIKGLDLSFENLPLDPTAENIELASEFVFEMWKARWAELKAEWESQFSFPYHSEEPEDLSGACKFSSIFAAVAFDAEIDGNYDHQFAVKKGKIIDLNAGAADVAALSKPYSLDPIFFGSRDHLASLKSCMPRVMDWLRAFDLSFSHALAPREHTAEPVVR